MLQALNYLGETPSQTAGPYVHIGLIPHQAGFDIFENNLGQEMLTPEVKGERITIEGRVLDGIGSSCKDILLEIWQADAEGRFSHPADPRAAEADPAFRGWGRTGTDFATGLYRFETIKPGRVPGRRGRKLMAPHISLWIVARGINIGLSTRLYFSDETEANAEDPVLSMIEPSIRRDTLIAQRSERDGKVVYTFDIRLQGESETVFFDV
ncbi:protocatechuate 3,4-dioxygenase subunit alpha [Roseomonas sp. OT10]|uniref:protocatechuate 3,4-dioxygenase subunit alpha n=1 Tax=Roseomonas cutis TaxID=2897332 RepID=UPI001E3EC6A7|nr:protocatechuate 3,4-dioxygenase subunit alpha [Roseomonas sp. OT10]UFN48544.1 protocatechuate 3,4-dioxygenase subunit alpha [Roseomonas sp. OT10]